MLVAVAARDSLMNVRSATALHGILGLKQEYPADQDKRYNATGHGNAGQIFYNDVHLGPRRYHPLRDRFAVWYLLLAALYRLL